MERLHISLDTTLDPRAHRTWWRLLDYLLLPTVYDEELNLPILSRRAMLDICARSPQDKDFKVGREVGRFAMHTGVLIWLSPWDSRRGMARVVEVVSWGRHDRRIRELAALIRRDHSPIEELVSMDQGRRVSPRKLYRRPIRTQKEALEALEEGGNPDAARLLRMLSEQAPHRWRAIERLLPELQAAAEKEPNAEYSLNMMVRARFNPQPSYKRVPKSSRIYLSGSSFLGVHRGVRRHLIELLGWHQFDLSSAQLAIISSQDQWDVPELREFLGSGQSFWTEMLDHLHWHAEDKDIVKRATYALIFGAGRPKLEQIFSERWNDANLGRSDYFHWRRHPLIEAITAAQIKAMARVRTAGFGVDVYGRHYPIERHRFRTRSGRWLHGTNIRSILACQAQAFELNLLAPALETIDSAGRHVQLTFWLHDGFGVSCTSCRTHKLAEIVSGVNLRCLGLRRPLPPGTQPLPALIPSGY